MCSSAHSSWPLLLDLSKDESKRILRNLELEAYGALVSAFRAQGDLNKQKKKLLQEVQHVLSISTERHRSEIRRAVNDEKLSTVADCIAGPDISSEWHVEGRRLVPIMPRLVPQTAFTLSANDIANQQSVKNISMPKPKDTAHKDNSAVAMAPANQLNTPGPSRSNKPTSPTPGSNVLVLPSGMSIHIKEDDQVLPEEEVQMHRRRRSSSAESLTLVRPSPSAPCVPTSNRITPSIIPAQIRPSSHPVIPHIMPSQVNSASLKVTMSKSPNKQHAISTTASGQKVIIVSSSSTDRSLSPVSISAQTPSTYLQRTISAVPVIKSSAMTTTVNTVMYPRSSVMMSASTASSTEQTTGRSNVITIAATAGGSGSASSNVTSVYQQAHISTGTIMQRPRVRTISARPRLPYHTARATAVAMNTSQAPSTQSIHIRPTTKPTIHIKQEGSMKIITQGTQGLPSNTGRIAPGTPSVAGRLVQGTPSTAGRILPKSLGSQVFVSTSSTPSITMVTKTSSAVPVTPSQGGKVLNISTSGGRILATSTPRTTGANVVTVNPKTLQLTTVKGPSGATATRIANPTGASKPNVIVVQKAQPKKITTISSTPTVQELVSFLQRQGPGSKELSQQRSILERKVIRPGTSGDIPTRRHVVVRQKSADGTRVHSVTLPSGTKSSILAGLIQAVGISQDNSDQGNVSSEDVRAVASITSEEDGSSQTGQNQWVEYDVQGDGTIYVSQDGSTKVTTSDTSDVSAIKALLELQSGHSGNRTIKVHRSRPSSLQLSTIHGEEITLQPILSEEPDSPEVQIIGTSGLDDESLFSNLETHRKYSHQLHKVRVMDESGNSVQVQISNPSDLSQITSLISQGGQTQQMVGEIDPHTCALYTSDGIEEASDTSQLADEVAIQVISSEDHEAEQAALLNQQGVSRTIILNTETSMTNSSHLISNPSNTVIDTTLLTNSSLENSSGEKIDFLSSALNQAQIDLDSYQEEATEDEVTLCEEAEEQMQLISILNRPNSVGNPAQLSEQRVTQAVPSQGNLPDLLVSTPALTQGTMANRVMTKAGNIHIRPQQIANSRTQFIPIRQDEKKPASAVHVIKSNPSATSNNQHISGLGNLPLSGPSVVSVSSEQACLDPNNMTLEDLSSQQHNDSDLSSEDILVTNNYSDNMLESSANVRLSKRKRKAPLTPDEVGSPTQSGWLRIAMGVLQKVMRVRGSYKEKGEMNAASWFTQPVDAREVPDYYEVIENPMDFGTIKRKLETNQYDDLEDFHLDVLLVRDNCHRYNPPGTDVRRDCDEVFTFYAQEYERSLAKCQQGYTSSPSKRSKTERSPIRP